MKKVSFFQFENCLAGPLSGIQFKFCQNSKERFFKNDEITTNFFAFILLNAISSKDLNEAPPPLE